MKKAFGLLAVLSVCGLFMTAQVTPPFTGTGGGPSTWVGTATSDLDMDGNNVTNVLNLEVTGNLTVDTNLLVKGSITVTTNVTANRFKMASTSVRLLAATSDGTIELASTAGVNSATVGNSVNDEVGYGSIGKLVFNSSPKFVGTNFFMGLDTDAANYSRGELWHDGTSTLTLAAGEAGAGVDTQTVQLRTKGTGALTHNSGTVDRFRSEGGTVTLTDNTATTIATLAVATNAVYGSKVFYTIRSVGTDYAQQAETGELLITGVNVDGTITSAAVSETSIQAVSAGTLTTDWTVTASGNTILLKCDADSDLTSPAITVIATFINSFGTITRP